MPRIPVGSPLLPCKLKAVDATDKALLLRLDTDERDAEVIRAVATAVRDHPETVGLLRDYADLRDRADESFRQGGEGLPSYHADTEDAADVLADIDANLDWTDLGAGMTARLPRPEAERLIAALVEQVARWVQSEDDRETGDMIRDLRNYARNVKTGGAA